MKEEVYEKIKDDLPEQLRQDIEKYGLENFDFEILDTASSKEELDRKQKDYIKKYNSLEPQGYNLPKEKKKYEDMSIDEVIELLVEVRVDLALLKKSITSQEIKEQLKWAINGIDIVGCELAQNIAKKLKDN